MYKPCQRALECIIKCLTNSSCCLAERRLKHSFVGKKMFVSTFYVLYWGLTMPIDIHILLGCREEVMVFFSSILSDRHFNDNGWFYVGATLKYYTQMIYPRIPTNL